MEEQYPRQDAIMKCFLCDDEIYDPGIIHAAKQHGHVKLHEGQREGFMSGYLIGLDQGYEAAMLVNRQVGEHFRNRL